ncbi:MAG: DUF4328 domain-containing protein [Planctomycetota bacterium]
MKSLQTRSKVVTGVFVAILLISGVAASSNLILLQHLTEFESGKSFNDLKAEAVAGRRGVVGMLQGGSFLVGAVTFLLWFHRAHQNLRAGGLTRLRYTPGWVVLGFLVPLLNLVRPYQVMQEVWAGSVTLSGQVEKRGSRARSPAPHVGWWWALCLARIILQNASAEFLLRAGVAWELLVAVWVTLASALIDIPAVVVAVLLIRRITDFQEHARTRLQADQRGS